MLNLTSMYEIYVHKFLCRLELSENAGLEVVTSPTPPELGDCGDDSETGVSI